PLYAVPACSGLPRARAPDACAGPQARASVITGLSRNSSRGVGVRRRADVRAVMRSGGALATAAGSGGSGASRLVAVRALGAGLELEVAPAHRTRVPDRGGASGEPAPPALDERPE